MWLSPQRVSFTIKHMQENVAGHFVVSGTFSDAKNTNKINFYEKDDHITIHSLLAMFMPLILYSAR